MKSLIILIACLFMCGASFAETSVSSGYFRISMGGTEVEQKYSKLQNVIVASINLAEECKCTVTIHRPDITVKWSESTPALTFKTMSWDAPTEHVDNTPLSADEIDHYIISYWLTGASEQFITVSGNKQERVIDGLSSGAWNFRVMVVETNGKESEWSELVEVVI